MSNPALERLRYHVTGAIERGEAEPIIELRDYKVTWEIDIRAESFEDAARKALAIQRDPESIATVFDVMRSDCVSMTIDLNQE